jgi:hypothetical protein
VTQLRGTTDEDAYIRRIVAEAPPLDADQRRQLAELLRPIRQRAEQPEVSA